MSAADRFSVFIKGTIGTTLIIAALCAPGDSYVRQTKDYSSLGYSNYKSTAGGQFLSPIEAMGIFAIPVVLMWLSSPFLLAFSRVGGRAAGCLSAMVSISTILVGGYCLLSVLSLGMEAAQESSYRTVTRFSWSRLVVIVVGFGLIYSCISKLENST